MNSKREGPPGTEHDIGEHITEAVATAPVIVFTADFNGERMTPVWVSENIARILGYTVEQVLAPGWWWQNVHPEDRPRAANYPRRIDEQGHQSHEYRFRHADGRWVRILDQHRLVDRGRIVGSWTDISELRAHETRIEVAEAHYRRLITTSPYTIYAVDAQGHFTELNPAGERLLRRSDLIGKPFSEVIAPESADVAARAFEDLIHGESPEVELELFIIRPGGERRLISLSATVIRDDVVIGAHGIARDITDERSREQQLRRAERLASVATLVGGVAHELNNPLTSIAGFAELMLLEKRSPEDEETLQLMRREATRAAKIVADLRVLARETHTFDEADRTAVDLNDIVRHVLKLQRYALDTSTIEVHEDLADGLPTVLGSATELEQVVLNLVINARQALEQTRQSPRRMSLRTHRAGEHVAITVTDNGPGIPEAEIERIFDPFYTTKSPGQGMGLGLSLVHRIITEHGGEVRVGGVPDRGASFTVLLPAKTAAEEDAALPEDARASQPLRILIVDDEEPIRRALERYLHRCGYTVDAAVDGEDALRCIARSDYDVIVTDLRMPVLSGEQMLEKLRRDRPELAERIIIITGHVARDDEELAALRQDVPLIEKPFALRDVQRLIEEHAARARTD